MALVLGSLLVTAIPIAIGARVGGRRGVKAMLQTLARCAAVSIGCGATAFAAFRGSWFQPIGLLTPLLLAMAVGMLIAVVLGAFAARTRAPSRRRASAIAGGVVGSLVGASAAALAWVVLPLLLATATDEPPRNRASAGLSEVASLVHRGLLRHLPLVGNASDEVAALVTVLRASPTRLQRLADAYALQQLLDLPALQRALADTELRRDLERLRDGSMLAWWRLQCHPRVIEVAECRAVQAMVADLRPTALVASMRAKAESR